MLENNKYNLGQEYEFHATIPLGRRSKGGSAIAIRKEISQKTKYKNNPPGDSPVSLPGWKGEKNSLFYISPPNRPSHRRRYKRPSGTAPSTYDTAERL